MQILIVIIAGPYFSEWKKMANIGCACAVKPNIVHSAMAHTKRRLCRRKILDFFEEKKKWLRIFYVASDFGSLRSCLETINFK